MANSVPILPPVTLGTGSQSVQAIGRCKDNGGNSFIGRLVVPGNLAYVEIFKKDSAGTVTKIDEFSMQIGPSNEHPEGHPRKAVDLHCMLDGSNVVSTVTGYNLTSPQRDHYQEEHVTHNVAVPFPQGVNPESGAGPLMFYEPEGGSGGGGGNVTHEQIVAAVREVIGLSSATLVQAIAGKTEEQGGNLRQGIEDKVKDAIAETRVVTEEMFTTTPPWEGGKSSPIIYEQLKNTSHSGALSALVEYGA